MFCSAPRHYSDALGRANIKFTRGRNAPPQPTPMAPRCGMAPGPVVGTPTLPVCGHWRPPLPSPPAIATATAKGEMAPWGWRGWRLGMRIPPTTPCLGLRVTWGKVTMTWNAIAPPTHPT